MDQQEMLSNLRKIKGIGDFELVAKTIKDANKKSRVTGELTPHKYQQITKIVFATVSLGNHYATEMNKKLGTTDFQAKKTYCIPIAMVQTGLTGIVESLLSKLGITFKDEMSKVLYKHESKDQFYVRVYPSLAKNYQENVIYYDNEGNTISDLEFKELQKEYFAADDDKMLRQYKLENIVYLGNKNKTAINHIE